ncbi:MAG: ribosome-associated ATPase/putative transporter RbbA [Neisseriaceae bacterium]|nr:ribosome-associated ATPase/putative transporter RbbA [Neisseriaceae bacterium]
MAAVTPPVVAYSVVAKGLSHHYQATMALAEVSLSLPKGTTIGLIGPDGVGKSTLLSLISGVKKMQQGELNVLGGNIDDRGHRAALSSRIAFMPQGLGRNLYPTLSVYENIAFFANLFGLNKAEREARIHRLLVATGLAPFPDRPAGKLSGGMKQKLGLCCALVHDPDLLILDEPTTGVDPLSRRQFWTLVDALRQDRPDMTVIVATAYIDEAERFEYLVAMDEGKVLVNGLTQQIMADSGSATLEEAYIKLLPQDKQAGTGGVAIPPLKTDPNAVPAIEAHELTKRFGKFTAVDKVSFTIPQGEIFGFLGSNGCGKSTTMKILTGLLDASSGTAHLLGQPVDAGDMATRMKIGYMSQAFSLYEELSVRENLALHAKLYRLEGTAGAEVVNQGLANFDLAEVADVRPAQLSLGMRQRLQLAAACLHEPQVLILDEPTSGVDPAARDMFWRHLVRLSREQQVTIFVSTHFMNEAERCDRISFMHQGRVLAVGTPQQLQENYHAATLEDAFVAYLEQEMAGDASQVSEAETQAALDKDVQNLVHKTGLRAWLARTWTFALRESTELLRDKIRLTFAVLGPLILLLIAAWNVSFDVDNVRFTVLDRDQTQSSRQFIEYFEGSRYFRAEAPIARTEDIDRVLQSTRTKLVIEIPSGFGRELAAGQQPQVAFYLDGAQPFTAQNVNGFISGIMLAYTADMIHAAGLPTQLAMPASIEPRFIYNQEFKSIYAITPGMIMLALILIPTMLTALGVVREKEMGSITNLYASPASVLQYLVGKQIPYVALAMVSYLALVLLSVLVLRVPVQGSFLAMTLGAFAFILAATALGLLMSCFVKSQVAAIFGTAILCMIPSVNFSGLLYPVSTLTGSSYWVGLGFPSSWYQLISLGGFTKGLGFASFGPMYLALFGFAAVYMLAASLLLKKQEA